MKINTKAKYDVRTHEGAKAFPHMTDMQALRRSVLSCMLWEDEFYEDGVEIGKRISELAEKVSPSDLAALAVQARSQFNLRHVPLLLLASLVKTGRGSRLVGDSIAATIQRPDELAEFLAIYWRHGRTPLAAQVKRGLALAFAKFNAYSLAKYNRDGAIKLRDVLFLSHAKPKNDEQAETWKKLVKGTLESPDTWEVALSAGANKKDTWERLIADGNLGYLALLRNLRNMEQAGVAKAVVKDAILARKGADRVLPFRYVAAAKYAPWAEKELDKAMIASLETFQKLPGHTTVVVDVSGSMRANLSGKSEMSRQDAAAALASIITGVAEGSTVWLTAGNDYTRIHKTERVPSRVGMAMVDLVRKGARELGGGGIFLTPVLRHIKADTDRLIVITDEQDCAAADKDSPLLAEPFGKYNYMLNVASAKNGIGYGKWTHIDGFSEAVLRFIHEYESQRAN